MAEINIPRFKYNPPKEQLTEEELLKAVGEMSYQSPVEIVSQNIREKYEGDMMQIIHSYDIHVDKDERVKALAYDRDQYKKGFADGCRLSMDRIRSEVAAEIFWDIAREMANLSPPHTIHLIGGRIVGKTLEIGREEGIREVLKILFEIEKKYTDGLR